MITHHLPKGNTMSNIDRAAEVIALALADDADVSIAGNYSDITNVSEATLDGKYDLTAVARALADAGRLKADPCHYVLPNIDPPIHSALGVRTQADCHDLWELPPHEDDEDWVNIWTDGARFAITHEGEPVATMDRAAARQLISALTTVLDETPEVTAEEVGTDDPA